MDRTPQQHPRHGADSAHTLPDATARGLWGTRGAIAHPRTPSAGYAYAWNADAHGTRERWDGVRGAGFDVVVERPRVRVRALMQAPDHDRARTVQGFSRTVTQSPARAFDAHEDECATHRAGACDCRAAASWESAASGTRTRSVWDTGLPAPVRSVAHDVRTHTLRTLGMGL